MELPNLPPTQALAEFRKWQKAFDDAGIPWNKKGSPHALRIKALHYQKQIPISLFVQDTIRMYAPQMAANITLNNTLLQALTRKSGPR